MESWESDGRGNGPGSTRETAGYSPLALTVWRNLETSCLVSLEAVEFLRIFVLALLRSNDRALRSSPPGRLAVIKSSSTASDGKLLPR